MPVLLGARAELHISTHKNNLLVVNLSVSEMLNSSLYPKKPMLESEAESLKLLVQAPKFQEV